MKKFEEYYIGLDMGTGSVGWAVTDPTYNIIKRHGKALWGIRLFESAKTAEESSRIAREHFPEIIHIAKEVIRQEGYDYPVEVKLSSVEFPVKTYGSYTFPAGTYQALEVIIGAGMGHHWWCVMYPNMCFEGSVYEVVDGKSEKVLKDTLSETEYQSLMEEKNYKISWKWLDFWDK